jgi:hypothetical protein
LAIGTDTVTVNYTPDASSASIYNSSSNGFTETLSKAAPAINWATPAAIIYGTALSAVQLNATTTVAGTFVYAPAVGTIPAAGVDTLSATFNPANTAQYTKATATVQLTVNQLSAITSPAPGSQLGTTTTFTWSSGTGVTLYELCLGTASGSCNLYNSGHTAATSATVSGLPINGSPVYAQLYSFVGGAWKYTLYTFVAAGPPQITSPKPGSILGSSATFTWSAGGTGVTMFALWLGTTGPGSYNIYNSGHTTATSAYVTGLPADGSTVYAEFYYYSSGAWKYANYTFIAAGPPAIISPTPGGVLGSTANFLWDPGIGATTSELTLGTTGQGSTDLYNSGQTSGTTANVTSIPNSGKTVYAQLASYFPPPIAAWQYVNYTYTETAPPAKSTLTNPTTGTALSASTTFIWSAGSQVTQYDLWVGTTGPGSSNLYNSGHTTAMSSGPVTVPQNGETVYVELYSSINGVWMYTNYTFKAQ